MSASREDVMQTAIEPSLLLKIAIQSSIAPVPAQYSAAQKQNINPAWQSIGQITQPLRLHSIHLFVLRNDFILATGVSNIKYASAEEGGKDYDHSSLMIGDMSASHHVFYAGFVCQRESDLMVFLSSTCFSRMGRLDEGIEALSARQTELIEAYLSMQFNQAYGEQPIVFYDTSLEDNEKELALFLSHTPFPQSKASRLYTAANIASVVQSACLDTNLGVAEQYIRKHITAVSKKYSYSNESNINPAYQDIACVRECLRPNEKRIWVLRSDFILATGIKNAYEKEYGYTGFSDSFNPSLHQYIDWSDRYGHPSLTLAEGNYDGAAYYAGYICQRDKLLQVYLVSGRFERCDLNTQQTAVLEAYIAIQFQAVFGLQDIVFDYGDSKDPLYHRAFFYGGFNNRGSLEGNIQRRYNSHLIKSSLKDLASPEINENFTHRFFNLKHYSSVSSLSAVREHVFS